MIATPAFVDLTPAETAARVRAGTLLLVDVRPPPERAIAAPALPARTLEDGGLEALLALPRDTPLAFLCHHGGRSAQAALHFHAHGFSAVHNVAGGVDAWALQVDPSLARY